EVADVLEALLPDLLAEQLFRDPLPLQHFGMDPDNQHLLVVRAVEDADVPALRHLEVGPPKEIMVELERVRRLERMHLAALRIEPGHHMLDDAVLAGGVHGLEDDQNRPAVMRIELLLERR